MTIPTAIILSIAGATLICGMRALVAETLRDILGNPRADLPDDG